MAYDNRKKYFGVKSHSVIALLPEFDLSIGTVVESMHNVYLVVTNHIEYMESSTHRNFVNINDTPIPAMIVKTSNGCHINRLPKVWETD